jgi:hypothetical protein
MADDTNEGATLLLELLQLGEGDVALLAWRERMPGRALGLPELRALRRAVLLLSEALYRSEGRTLMHTAAELLHSAASGGWRGPNETSPESSTVPTFGETAQEADTRALRSPLALARHSLEVDGRRMSLPEYAALSAACGAFPDRVRETHAKFGVSDDAARRRLDEAWQKCFSEDGELEELWRTLRSQFRAWLVQYGQL